jgi:hypothetical protein
MATIVRIFNKFWIRTFLHFLKSIEKIHVSVKSDKNNLLFIKLCVNLWYYLTELFLKWKMLTEIFTEKLLKNAPEIYVIRTLFVYGLFKVWGGLTYKIFWTELRKKNPSIYIGVLCECEPGILQRTWIFEFLF